MSESNAHLIHNLCTEQASAFEHAADLLPAQYQNDKNRILTACMIAHALDLNPATVMFGLHLKTPGAPAHKAEKQEKPKKQQESLEKSTLGWPRLIDGVWIDSADTEYVEGKHGWNKSEKMPSVKTDGTFRSARQGKSAKKDAPNPAQAAPDNQPKHNDSENEQALLDANQVLSSFKNHIDAASNSERLEQLGGQIELMGFTPTELTVARRWISERVEALELA